MPRHVRRGRALYAVLFAWGCHACTEPPPKIPSLPPSGFALRLYVFGASAEEAHRTFAAVKENNPAFRLVAAGGDGEVLVGLENDSPHCVAPTALCSYRVSYRIRDNSGAVVAASTTSIEATSDRCPDLCEQALRHVAVKLIETAVTELTAHVPAKEEDAAVDGGAPPAHAPAQPRGPKAGAKTDRKPEPAICSAGRGPRLPSSEAEKRAAQVEVLKRLSLIDQDEYDCLRKAYLDRL